MRWTASMRYVAGLWRVDTPRVLREWVYLTLLAAVLAAFASLMPALEYRHAAALEAAAYDVWISGPVTRTDRSTLLARADVGSIVGVRGTEADRIEGPRTDALNAAAARGTIAYAYDAAADLDAGPYPDELLVSGRAPLDGELACDWSTARRLDLRAGDAVAVRLASPAGGTLVTGTLAGVYGPSGPLLRSIAVPAPPGLRAGSGTGDDADWTDLYVTADDPEGLAREITASESSAGRLLALPRAALRREASVRLVEEAGPFLESGASLTALAGLLAVALFQQSTRLARRRRSHGVLLALGARAREIARLAFIEQAALLFPALAAGVGLASWLLAAAAHTFVPPPAVRGLLALGLGVCVATSLAAALAAAVDAVRMDVSRVVRSG